MRLSLVWNPLALARGGCQEVCDFTVWDMDKKIDRFQGSFIDAMMWLVNNKKDCVTPEQREKLKLF